MAQQLGGPLFSPAQDAHRRSVFGKEGGHYNIFESSSAKGMDFLRDLFPTGKADEMNFVLFSTSGIHGHYGTIEEAERSMRAKKDVGEDETVTFLLVQPRIVSMTYGNVTVRTKQDIAFLKKLRASSWKRILRIGAPPAGGPRR